jgi:predicted anti-sigma-YlaC factor YlaD
MNSHLSNDELLNRLYGVSQDQTSDDGHLESCPQCARRWQEMRERRALSIQESGIEVPEQFFSAQRNAIYARLEKASPRRWLWAPAAVAAGGLLAVGLFVHRPATPPRAESTDVQLFSDVYSMEQSAEPAAAAPIHALFEDGQ